MRRMLRKRRKMMTRKRRKIEKPAILSEYWWVRVMKWLICARLT